MVQGDEAPNQIISAIKHFNEMETPPEIIAILRGGGSRDDLIAFDDELLVREIASSRVPTIVGVGHEIDVTLADLAADVRASTPSNAAEILVPDKREIMAGLDASLKHSAIQVENKLDKLGDYVIEARDNLLKIIGYEIEKTEKQLEYLSQTLRQLDPKIVLKRGYAIVRDSEGKILKYQPKIGDNIGVENNITKFQAEVKLVDM